MLDAECTGKVGYKTRNSAGRTVDAMRKRGTLYGKIQVYKCEVCGLYHMGATMRKKRERMYG